MKTLVTVEVVHDEPIHALAERVAMGAWSIPGVILTKAVDAPETPITEMLRQGFTLAELSLACGEVHRG